MKKHSFLFHVWLGGVIAWVCLQLVHMMALAVSRSGVTSDGFIRLSAHFATLLTLLGVVVFARWAIASLVSRIRLRRARRALRAAALHEPPRKATRPGDRICYR